MLRNFVRDFVALEHMLQRPDFDAKTFHQPQESEDLVLAIRVTVNPALALDNFSNGLEFKVTANRSAVWLLPFIQIPTRRREPVGQKRLHSHPALGETRHVPFSPIRLLH